MTLTIRGQLRSGTSRIERTHEHADMAVARRYLQRWRWLEAERDGRVVGEIVRHPDTGHRTWWAER